MITAMIPKNSFIDVMVDFFCIITSVQYDVRELKFWITCDKFFNNNKDKFLICFISWRQKGDKRHTANCSQTLNLMAYCVFMFVMAFA